MKNRNFGMVSVAVTVSAFVLAGHSAEAKPSPEATSVKAVGAEADSAQRGSYHEIVINATPEAVYNAIIQLREDSQDSVKQLSHDANSCLLEETFPGLPFVGHVKCVYREVYTPNKRIDYYLVRSDRFKAFEGCWQIRPTADGTGTRLSLCTYVDVDIVIPFVKQITKMQTSFAVKERLQEVRQTCDKMRVAQAKIRAI